VVILCCIVKERLDHDTALATDIRDVADQGGQPRLLVRTLSVQQQHALVALQGKLKPHLQPHCKTHALLLLRLLLT
jgi:hypothetical protein